MLILSPKVQNCFSLHCSVSPESVFVSSPDLLLLREPFLRTPIPISGLNCLFGSVLYSPQTIHESFCYSPSLVILQVLSMYSFPSQGDNCCRAITVNFSPPANLAQKWVHCITINTWTASPWNSSRGREVQTHFIFAFPTPVHIWRNKVFKISCIGVIILLFWANLNLIDLGGGVRT